jgi:hypothetical protein
MNSELPAEVDPFWYDDITILYKKNRMVEFVPTQEMALNEKLNALARLAIYVGVLTSIVYQNANLVLITVLGMGLSYFLYRNSSNVAEAFNGTDDYDDQISVDGNGMQYQKPTKNNPFMNVLLTDYVDNPQRPPAGNIEDPGVISEVKDKFNYGLYRNVEDIWDNANSQRQYYSNPSTTIPNDRHSFMNWCWNIPYSCKDGDLAACLDVDGPRRHGQI